MKITGTATTSDRELVFERLLNAPRELVFRAWTEPEHIIRWWGPDGFTNTNKKMDVRPGGEWTFTMHGPDGRDYPNKIKYLDVKKPELLIYEHMDDGVEKPVSFHVTVNFIAEGNKTRLIMKMVFESAEELQRLARESGANEGANQTLARLAAHLVTMN